jgi:hypothetical protein
MYQLEKLKKFIITHKAFSLTMLNIVLVVLVLLQKDPLGIFYKTYDTADSFFQISRSDIQKIQYGRVGESNGSKELYQENGIWKNKISNSSYRVDEEKLDRFLKSILSAKKFTIVTNNKDKESDYGFGGNESFFVEIFDKTNQSKGKLLIGNLVSGGNFTYVKWNEGPEIYLVEDNLKTAIGRGALDYFINKRINPVSFSTDEIIAFSLKDSFDKKNNYELIKKDSVWFMGGNEKVEEEKIKPILSKITSISPEDVLLEPVPELADLNRYQFSYSYKRGENPTTMFLEILGKDKSSNQYYFRLNNESTIYKANEYQFKDLIQLNLKKK